MKQSLISLVFFPLLALSFILSGCTTSPSQQPLPVSEETPESALEKQWEKHWETRLKNKTDIDAAANCVFGQEISSGKEKTDKKPPKKFWITFKMQCVQTVLDAWGDAPQGHTEVVAVIRAYMVLAQDAQDLGDKAEAKRLKLKALSYLKQGAFILREGIDHPRYNAKRIEYAYQYNSTGYIYSTELVLTLLGRVKMLDKESQVCIYPRELELVFTEPEFKKDDFLREACSNDVPLLERKKWKMIWDDEHYTKHKKTIFDDPCKEVKRFKPVGQGVFVLSSHPGGKGLIYTGEPYKIYQDGCLVKKALTNDKGELIFDYADESYYVLEFFTRKMTLTDRPKIFRPFKK